MTDIREYLTHKPLLFDGGMGTYYKAAPGVECELANLTDPEGVKRVHAEYLAAGAQAIKTNTFGLPRMAAAQMPGWEELAEAAPVLRKYVTPRRTPPSLRTSARLWTRRPPRPAVPTALQPSSSRRWGQRISFLRRSARMWAWWMP